MTGTDRRADYGLLRVRVLADPALIAALAPELDELAEACGAPASSYWAADSAWFRARPEVQPLAVAVYDRSRLAGAAMLGRHRLRGVWRVIGAGTAGEPYAMPVASPEVAQVLAAGITGELQGIVGRWKLELTDLPLHDPVAEALAARLTDPVRLDFRDAPQLRIDHDSALNTYLSRNVRAAVAKARNRIAADGRSLELRWLTAPDQIERRLEQLVDVRARRNRQLHRGNPHDGAELATFTGTISNQAAAGRARLLEVRIDDRLASYALCFLTTGTLWVYSNTVSPDFTRYSAGTIANAEVVRYAHARPEVHILSWGRGIQRYKLSGPADLTGCQSLTAWSSTSTRRLLTIGRTLRSLSRIG